jgi:hypothetical protein
MSLQVEAKIGYTGTDDRYRDAQGRMAEPCSSSLRDYSTCFACHTNARFCPQTLAHDSVIHTACCMPVGGGGENNVIIPAYNIAILSCDHTLSSISPARLRRGWPSSDTPSRPCACLLAHALPLALHLLAHPAPHLLCSRMQLTGTNTYWPRLVANRLRAPKEHAWHAASLSSSSRRFPQTLGCHQSLLLFVLSMSHF